MQRLARPGGHDDLIRSYGDVVVTHKLLAERISQLRYARARGISGMPAPDRIDGGITDMRRCREVRLTESEIDAVCACRFEHLAYARDVDT